MQFRPTLGIRLLWQHAGEPVMRREVSRIQLDGATECGLGFRRLARLHRQRQAHRDVRGPHLWVQRHGALRALQHQARPLRIGRHLVLEVVRLGECGVTHRIRGIRLDGPLQNLDGAVGIAVAIVAIEQSPRTEV